MAGSLRHNEWYLICDQVFRPRAAVSVTQQMFRGEPYLVLSDRITGQNLRLSQRAEMLWKRLDGHKSAQNIWDDFCGGTGPAPTQGEMVEWIITLVSSGLLLSDHELDPKHLSERGLKRRNQMIEARVAGPLAMKIGLFDPSWLIAKLFPLFRPLFSVAGGWAILTLLIAALVGAVIHADDLANAVDRNLLSQSGLVALAIAYPFMKVLHELSHGFAVHRFGGEVREFGVMFLVFFPVPYVEASESSAFADKYARMLVAAAGVIAELVMASLAFFAWLYMEPGIERAILFNLMVIGSLSTLLFNGNPLLKFDSYFVLSDWLEMPNLATRAGAYLSDQFLSRLLGLRPEVFPAPGEAKILVTYGVLSLAYRLVLTVTITLIVSQLFFVLGVALALWALITGVGWPIVKLFKKGAKMAKSQNQTRRSLTRFVAVAALVIGGGGFVPVPFLAIGEGQITPAPQAALQVGSSGRIDGAVVQNGRQVAAGDALLTLENTTQTARAETLSLVVKDIVEALARGGLDVISRQAHERELALAQAALDDVNALETARTVRAPLAGRVSWGQGREPIKGSFVFRGDHIGQIVSSQAIEVISSFPAAFAGYLPDDLGLIELRLPDGTVLNQKIARAGVVDAGGQAPASVLVSGGGQVPEMPQSEGKALAAAMVVWVRPDVDLAPHVFARVTARIHLPDRPLFAQAAFHLRRLFLRVTRV